jgi:ATP adenylyltransferase
MEYLWAPWRMEYINKAIENKDEGCILCLTPDESADSDRMVLYRGKYNFVIMNAFPYNSGHLMVAPFEHAAMISQLSEQARHEHIDIVSRCLDILAKAIKPAGFNVGLNLGRVAGAGVEKHMHCHVVPRWGGDTNFMPVISNTKVVNETLEATFCLLKPYFDSLKENEK